MVDCGNLRCFQERRSIKKDLLSWSKKIPLVVGLETIAEQVGSKRKVKKLFEPFNCLENDTPQDWEPEENCFYCKDRIQLLFDAIEKTDSKGGGKILRDHPSLRHLGAILPFCPQFYTSNFGRDILTDIKTCQNEPEPPKPPAPPVPPAEPIIKPGTELRVPQLMAASKLKKELAAAEKKNYSENDLSAAVTDIRNGKLGTRRAASLYGIPRSTLRNKVCKLDIDDGTVSSTMMTEDEEGDSNDSQPTFKQLNTLPLQTLPNTQNGGPDLTSIQSPIKQLQTSLQQPVLNTQPLLLSDLIQFSTLQYLAPFAMPYIIQTDMTPYFLDTEWEKKLQHIRHKHNLSGIPTNQYSEKAHKHKLKPYQCELIKKLIRERLELERREASDTGLCQEDNSHSLTHSIIMKSLEQSGPLSVGHHVSQVESSYETHSAIIKALSVEPLVSKGSTSADINLPSKLNIPAYSSRDKTTKTGLANYNLGDIDKRPYDGLFKYENTRIGDTLKDIIVKTISEKVRCKLESTDFTNLVGSNSDREKQKAKETILSAFSIPEVASPAKKIKREPVDSENSKSSNNSSNSTQTKKTRPKRGQYRKYNSQLLTEAVKAVQRGEMSVHRAGSYYGVPHSTLEYKVKERHLLRQKKIKEQQEQKMKEAEEAKLKAEKSQPSKPSTSAKTSTSPTKAAIEALSLSPPKTFPGPSWLPPFAGPSPFENAAALGLFGSGFALNTPASELLRKLQHKVQSKSDSGDEDSSCNSKLSSMSEGYVYIS